MKKGIAIILIGAHLMAVFHFTVPYVSYYANFHYFATELCVNQDNPELDCNGACQLDEMFHRQHQQKKDVASHYVDRAPKVDFFFQTTVVLHHSALSHPQIFSVDEHQFKALWYAEPSSPPPQLG
ncbi:hypothetical protein [Fodinibius salsisoli]|uniref:Transmembrane protein n=1 Tax=Fodinibius salsisoli TaxID=2820877 RepID=A0ABT3PMK6_9BACT|nr:hypothetical protein [Fodinibius salsisoli]MCW9707095.1 hypothetical protein [Fodinibius salsisoli]